MIKFSKASTNYIMWPMETKSKIHLKLFIQLLLITIIMAGFNKSKL